MIILVCYKCHLLQTSISNLNQYTSVDEVKAHCIRKALLAMTESHSIKILKDSKECKQRVRDDSSCLQTYRLQYHSHQRPLKHTNLSSLSIRSKKVHNFNSCNKNFLLCAHFNKLWCFSVDCSSSTKV